MNYLVVIPYIQREAQGMELELAINGWLKHFKEDFTLVIVGDWNPILDRYPIVRFLNCPRVTKTAEGNYLPHIDFVKKFTMAMKYYPGRDGFIYSCDDIYAVNDFTIDDVKALKYIGWLDYNPQSPNAWRRDAMRTQRKLRDMGFPQRDFTTHTPVWFDWEKLKALFVSFNMSEVSYVVETLYFNYFHPVSPAVLLDGDDKYKYTSRSTRPDIERLMRAFSEKIWINNNPDGYVTALESLLKEHYGL